MRPRLITFDVFGTILDWKTGIESACRDAGRVLVAGEFDRIIDVQGRLEREAFADYESITQRSLRVALGMDQHAAAGIAGTIAQWPLYPDAPVLRSLMEIVPCGAMTNSDRRHGQAIQQRLGFRLTAWLCAEDIQLYKPNPDFWRRMSEATGVPPSPAWWHVSAYADYDIEVAGQLGLTTVFVERPHAKRGPASHIVPDLEALRRILSETT